MDDEPEPPRWFPIVLLAGGVVAAVLFTLAMAYI